jgi:hypothetical protein
MAHLDDIDFIIGSYVHSEQRSQGLIGSQVSPGTGGANGIVGSQGVIIIDNTCANMTLKRSIPAEEIEEAVLQILEKYGIFTRNSSGNMNDNINNNLKI